MHLATQRNSHSLNRKRACTECARARERCSRGEPCLRCTNKSLQCLYPDDSAQKAHSPTNETSTSAGNEHGQLEEYSHQAPRDTPILPKQGSFMASGPLHRGSLNEDDIPFREFLHTLRPPTLSSYQPNQDLLSKFSYKSDSFHQERHSHPTNSHRNARGELGDFADQTFESNRLAPLFDRPSLSFNRPHPQAAINLDEPLFGEYPDLCSMNMPFDYHSDALSSSTSSPSRPRHVESQENIFLPTTIHAETQHGMGFLEPLSDSEGLCSATAAAGCAWQRLQAASDLSFQPINIKVYERIASQLKDLCLEHGEPACDHNNISVSQRTAQHELFVKLYYEHFTQQQQQQAI